MNVLITQHRLKQRGGTEMYIFDLARNLIARGHRAIVYSPQVGELEAQFRAATIPVIDDLNRLQMIPDVIHGQHSIETLSAMLHFAETPAIYVLHDWGWVIDQPPLLDRIATYIAVDETCYDRLVVREGIPADRAIILQNAVDLDRFQKRPPLPKTPRKALMFSNYAAASEIKPIRTACSELGIDLNLVGSNAQNQTDQPEILLRQHDLVFAKGRCAREAIAVGCAVVVADAQLGGGLVTAENVQSMAGLNFGRRLLRHPISKEFVVQQVQKYDAADATRVSDHVRAHAGLDPLVDNLIDVYERAINRATQTQVNPILESRQISDHLRRWSIELAAYQSSIEQQSNGQPRAA